MRAPSFADLLDEALRGAASDPAAAAARAWAAAPLPGQASPLLFARATTSALPRWFPLPEARPRRDVHRLNELQQRAFDLLASLGATLPGDFSAPELRREYRRLARRYHPDRHCAASVSEREVLARHFAEATAGYRCLREVVEPRH